MISIINKIKANQENNHFMKNLTEKLEKNMNVIESTIKPEMLLHRMDCNYHSVKRINAQRLDLEEKLLRKLVKVPYSTKGVKGLKIQSSWCDEETDQIRWLEKGTKRLSALKDVSIQFSNINKLGLVHLRDALKNLTLIESINVDLASCDLDDIGIQELSKGLKALHSLKRISLKLTESMSVTSKGLHSILQCLKHLSFLQNISIDFPLVFPYFWSEIWQFLKNVNQLTHLVCLHFYFSFDLILRMGFLKAKNRKSGESAVLKDRLFACIFDKCSVTNFGIQQLCQIIFQLKDLKDINFEFYDLCIDDISDEERQSFGNALEVLTSIERISLQCSIRRKCNYRGVYNLIKALNSLKCLLQFDLCFSNQDFIFDECIQGFGKGLGELKLQKTLGLRFCLAENKSMKIISQICQGLQQLTSLQDLRLKFLNNPKETKEISAHEIESICESLKSLISLEKLELFVIGFSSNDKKWRQKICVACQDHPSLKTWDVFFESEIEFYEI